MFQAVCSNPVPIKYLIKITVTMAYFQEAKRHNSIKFENKQD